MILEQRHILRWVTFPKRTELRPGWRTVYLQCAEKVGLPTHVRRPFITYCLDLDGKPEERLFRYSQKLRQNIHRARRAGITIERDDDPTEVVRLFRPTAEEKGLNAINRATFRSKPNLLVTRAIDPSLGVLAAHAYLLDPESGRVKGEYNASAFRAFAPESEERYRCGQANSLLYHEDLAFFQAEGFCVYDFGGYGGGSVAYFKDRFKGRLEKQYNYYPIWYFAWRQLRQWRRNRRQA